MVAVEVIKKRYKHAASVKAPWIEQYDEAFLYCAPQRQRFYDEPQGQKKTNPDKVFDSTAIHALDGFVSNLQSTLFPPGKRWIRLKVGSQVAIEEREDQQKNLDLITETMFDYLRISNFDTELSVALSDFAAGVGALHVGKGNRDNPLHFSATHIAEMFLEEGPNGRVDGNFRKSKVAYRNLEGTWPEATFSQALKEKISETPDELVCVLEAVLPSKIKEMDPETEKMVDVDGYKYHVIVESTNEKIFESSLPSSPWVVFRWPTLSGEVWARGPLLKALPDIKTLNLVQELILKNGALHVTGAYTVLDDGVMSIDNIVIKPGALIPVESNGGTRGPTIAPLPRSGSMDLGQIILNDKRASINKALYAEPLGPIDAPVRTATEVAYRQQELAKRIGAAFGRLQFELMIPLINRILFILDDLGLIKLGKYRVDGKIIGIEYESPLAQAQDMDDLNNIRTYMSMMVELFGPQIGMMMVKLDEVAKIASQKLRIPQSMIPSQDEFAQMKQAVVQIVAMQTAAQQQTAMQAGGGQPPATEGRAIGRAA